MVMDGSSAGLSKSPLLKNDRKNNEDQSLLKNCHSSSLPESCSEEELQNSVENEGKQNILCGFLKIFLIPFTDHTGDPSKVMKGILGVLIQGVISGFLMPKNSKFSSSYGYFSSIVGYTYFVCWSISFYPQVLMNYKRKTTIGLSPDFVVLNLFGFSCYSVYTSLYYWDGDVQRNYKEAHGSHAEITVQSNDVLFALHATLLCFVQFVQLIFYDGFKEQALSKWTVLFLAIALLAVSSFMILYSERKGMNWLPFLDLLASIKLIITITKYIPQVLSNRRRQSTEGWNIWNIMLDFTGGTLSLIQLVCDSIYMKDIGGIFGNWIKLGLSFVSIFFDMVFFLQHYVWYNQVNDHSNE